MKKIFLELAITFKTLSFIFTVILLAEFVYEVSNRPVTFVGLLLFPIPFLVAIFFLARFFQKKLEQKLA